MDNNVRGWVSPVYGVGRMVEAQSVSELTRYGQPALGTMERVCAAMIITDTLAQSKSRLHNDLPINRCKSSYSWCMSQLLALNASQKQ